MAIQFGPEMKNDSRQWAVQNLSGNKRQILAELVPSGDSIKSWKEMASQQIEFTGQPLREFTDAWKKGLIQVEPDPSLKETTLEDGSILIEYEAPQSNENGIRKFMKGPDAIYMIAYHVRPASKREDTIRTWRATVANSKLIPNPEGRR